MQVGDKVRHWFAGTGTVISIDGKKNCRVKWDSGSVGGAKQIDCKPVRYATKRNPKQQKEST